MKLVRILLVLVTTVGVAAALDTATAEAAPPTISVDGSSPGRTFDGAGALSAGASSRLLIDYPEPARSRILDYLFKPGYGAALQILKVEIGGDTNSTDGAEPSHMRTPDSVDCNRGYEWWLMEQAEQRNPDIKLAALEWGAAGWVGNGAWTVWTSQNLTYLLSWLDCAKRHGLAIDYLGGWNEAGFNANWYVQLRQALDAHGYGDIKIVADDSYDWTSVAAAMQSNPAFKQAVDIIGQHYPCAASCPTPQSVLDTGKPIWASESGSNPFDLGAAKLAANLNHEYVDGRMTSMINWSLEWSAYEGLPFGGNGLLLANTPWSGHYQVGKSVWAMAQTTQFTEPGWRYLDSGSMRIPGGSVVSLRDPDTDNWSSVAETLDATDPQQVQFAVGGGLSTGTVHVWSTDLRSNSAADWFVREPDVTPQDGRFTTALQPGRVYTFTTTSGQGRGSAAPPAAAPWQLPYNETFESYPDGATPRYVSDLEGAFETAPCAGRDGTCLAQVVTQTPVYWDFWYDHPATVVGDPTSWRNYAAAVDAQLRQPGWVDLTARASGPGDGISGYHFRIGDNGQWSVYRIDSTGLNSNVKKTTLLTGTAAFGVDAWHRIGLRVRGDEVVPTLDGVSLGTALDDTYSTGQVGLEVSPWARAQFDNMDVTPLPVAGTGPELGAVSPDPAVIASAGGGVQLATTVRNPGATPATDVAAQLDVPAGWTASPVTALPDKLAAGQAAPVAWQVSAPATATPGRYPAALRITYREAGLGWIATASVPIYLEVVPQSQMTATATSAQGGYPASNAIDGNESTLWHTSWSPRVYPPQSITLTLGGDYSVRGLLYLPRQDGNPNGVITHYRVFVSPDGSTFTQVGDGTWPLDKALKRVDFPATDARYVRLEAEAGGGDYVSAAEINIIGSSHRE
ncbi:MAG TPA: discoidin domain-containing protein [Jatrophihabitans sp.]|jgi:O-glycosyl hydrolase|nr:discoidin domain-containing protein [Jatrophihabitans sp.]